MKRILIFNVNWLGDVLFSTAVIRNIRRNYPDSFIACVIPERCLPILEGNPYLNEIVFFDERLTHRSVWKKIKFILLLKKKRFDMVYLLHRSFSRALICLFAGIPERIGYGRKKLAFVLTKSIPLPVKDSLHRIDHYLNIIIKAGLKVTDRFPELFISQEERDYAESFLKDNALTSKDFLVGINPGGNWLPKRWPVEYWGKLCAILKHDFGAKVIVSGSVKDIELAEKIKDLAKSDPFIACGKLSLRQFAALAAKLDIFISADSGPLHIANAAGAKKIVALFGPTSGAITAPVPADNTVILTKDTGCKIPCYEVNCVDNRCMKAITPEEVAVQVKSIMEYGKNK